MEGNDAEEMDYQEVEVMEEDVSHLDNAIVIVDHEEEVKQVLDKMDEVNDNRSNNDEDSDGEEDGLTCPICMDSWTNAGEHRLCALKCGHLFGHSCIMRWLKETCNSTNRRCPQCNKKATIKDIWILYAKKLLQIDTSELEKLRRDLNAVTEEKNRIELQLSKDSLQKKMLEQELEVKTAKIAELEKRQAEMTNKLLHSKPKVASKKFHLARALEISKEAGCRVLEYNGYLGYIVVSQKNTSPLFPGFGVVKVDVEKFQLKNYIQLHNQAIRGLSFNPAQQNILLSVGFDKCAKIVDVSNSITLHTFNCDSQLWSCCWAGDNSNVFLAGASNGIVTKYDIRNTALPVGVLESPGDRSPVVSLTAIPPGGCTGIEKGGFVACRLNNCYAYEDKDGVYCPKQMFLEGPFVSSCYDQKNNHLLISARPNPRQPQVRHVLCSIEKDDREDSVACNPVHTFHGGTSCQSLSRACFINVQDDTYVAAHQESTSTIPLWSVSSGKQAHSLPITDPVIDMCSFEVGNSLLFATLSSKKLRLYACE